MAEQGTDGFTALWPTVFLRRTLPGAEVANQALAALILELDEAKADLTTDYLGGNFLVLEHPAVAWLRDCINRTVTGYFAELAMNFQIDWSLHGWANVNRLGDYHDPHNHPHCYLSGTYYVQVPTERAPLKSRKDVRPGAITFYDPRGPAVNMNAIRGDPYVNPEHTVMPAPGQILLWPAFLMHFVHPNLSETPRISISFNVMLKWSDAYVPAQN
jgi:uncharacterized protein (TIGR02466 family)